MRLLPNHLRIAVTERTPVAFVRQGTRIDMVDANGVLLDVPPDAPGDPHYSFPVITGISGTDPLSIRAARMKIYQAFTTDLDSTNDHISAKLSEVDLSNPEDIKALIPEGSNDVLVHFGDTDFLSRYQKFEQHLPEWRTQYPKLASVDMRYDRQVVLEMQPGTQPPAPASDVSSQKPTASSAESAIHTSPGQSPGFKGQSTIGGLKARPTKPVPAAKLARKPAASAPAPTTASPASDQEWHMVVVKPHTKARATPAKPAKTAHPPQAAAQ